MYIESRVSIILIIHFFAFVISRRIVIFPGLGYENVSLSNNVLTSLNNLIVLVVLHMVNVSISETIRSFMSRVYRGKCNQVRITN